MRLIGSVSEELHARRFRAHLLARDVQSTIEQDGDSWDIWIHDEDQVASAKEELEAFRAAPDAERYQQAEPQAARVEEKAVAQRKSSVRKTVHMRDRWNAPAAQRVPVTLILIIGSALVTLGTNFGRDENDLLATVKFSQYDPAEVVKGDQPQLGEIRDGEVWRLVTPILLHLSILHFVFNMYWTWAFGNILETRIGTRQFIFLVLASAILSNIAQTFAAGPNFGGMSGVVYALFGYAWVKSECDRRSGIRMAPMLPVLMIGWLFLCMTGALGPVANTAHAVGLIAGMAIAYLPLCFAGRPANE